MVDDHEIPMKNGYFIGNINPTFSDKPKLFRKKSDIEDDCKTSMGVVTWS